MQPSARTLVLVLAASIGAVGVPFSASAAEPFMLWRAIADGTGSLDIKIIAADLFPATPGREAIGLGDNCVVSAPDEAGKITATYRLNLVVKPAAGGANLFTTAPPILVTTSKFPDPRLAQFQCNAGTQTDYGIDGDGDDLGVAAPEGANCNGPNQRFDPAQELCDGYPYMFRIGFGRAEAGAADVIVVGSAAEGEYRNSLEEQDIGSYAISGYDTNGTRLYSIVFKRVAQDLFLEPDLAMVGDFLDSDGIDEIRIGRIGHSATSNLFKYSYYNVLTGALISSTTVTANCPLGACRNN